LKRTEERTVLMKKLALLLSLLALAAFGFAACGGDDDEDEATTEAATTETTTEAGGGGGGGGSVSLTADPNGALAYEESTLTAPTGTVTIEFDNPASLGHDVVVEDADGNEITRTDVISQDTATAEGEFEAGDYTYYCSVDAHREAGMEGTLTIE
jgi:plastocyanin